MFSMDVAGICCNAVFASRMVGLQSIKTVKLPLPLKLTFQSMSTVTEGMFYKTSTAVPDSEVMFSLTFMTFLSIW